MTSIQKRSCPDYLTIIQCPDVHVTSCDPCNFLVTRGGLLTCNSGATGVAAESSGAGPANSSKASRAAKGSTGGGGGAANS
jgi:hypothetical protein